MAKQHICIYGPSGTFKTSALATFVNGMYRATGKRARLYNVDGGVASIQHLIDAGIVDIWEMNNQPYPFEALLDASRGYWPVDPNDPASKLEPPTLVRYVAECQACQTRPYDEPAAKQTTSQCPKCKAVLPVKARQAFNPANKLDDIGCLLYEGLTGFSERLMQSMADKIAANDGKLGGDVAINFKDGNVKIAGVTQSCYYVGQQRPKQAVDHSRMIPVPYVIWTAHKEKGKDDVKGTPVCGPKLVGTAATSDAPRWFGPLLSATNWPAANGTIEKRLYIQTYIDQYETPCNCRIPTSVLDGVPQYYTFDKTKKGEFGAETFLWDIVQMIERKQREAAEMALKEAKKK